MACRLLEMTNELFIPALDTDGGWDVDGTPLSLFRFGGLTPEVPLPAVVNRDGTTSPSLSPSGIGPSLSSQAIDLGFGASAAGDFAGELFFAATLTKGNMLTNCPKQGRHRDIMAPSMLCREAS